MLLKAKIMHVAKVRRDITQIGLQIVAADYDADDETDVMQCGELNTPAELTIQLKGEDHPTRNLEPGDWIDLYLEDGVPIAPRAVTEEPEPGLKAVSGNAHKTETESHHLDSAPSPDHEAENAPEATSH